MNWEALGATGETLGAVAVCVTLAYLAMQIRQNSQLMRSQMTVQLITSASEKLQQVAGNGQARPVGKLINHPPAGVHEVVLAQRAD